MTTRREFIKQGAILATGAIVSKNSFALNFISKPKIIVLGAGISGLGAARKLSEKNYDVTILEARNRIGGRIFSHTIDENDNLVVELGAEWVGDSHDKLKSLCNELGLELINNRFDDRLIYDNKFYKPEEWDYSPEWREKFDKLLKSYATMSEKEKIHLDKMDWWRFLMNNDIPQRDLDIREYSDSTDFGESIRFVSAYSALAEYAESNEFDEMDWKVKGGNSLIIKSLADKIGTEKILTGHKVDTINYDSKIKIHCSNGATFECDKLICALPTYSMSKINWIPALPQEKIDALNQLQYCRINKSATLFKERFWNDEKFSILTDTFSHYFYHASKFQNSPKGVLISYSVGDKADIMSRLTKEQREDTLADSLSVAFGDVRNQFEKNVNYYWGTDEFTKGAYALYGRGQWFSILGVLREKVKDIHFAGEHIADWQGFMEGALISGEEAADSI